MVDGLGVAVVLVSVFLIGTAEVFADTTANTLMPMIVAPGDLGLANSRAGRARGGEPAGRPADRCVPVRRGDRLAARRSWWCSSSPEPPRSRVALPAPERRLDERRARHEIAEGLRWLWTNRPVRTLTITVVSFNVTFGAAWSVLVLVASERLGLGEVGFGVLTTMSALGAVLGAWGTPASRRRSAWPTSCARAS
ncbi:MAG: hypothetical protein R2713_02110 [Ilumatobacteraceae bacterium]